MFSNLFLPCFLIFPYFNMVDRIFGEKNMTALASFYAYSFCPLFPHSGRNILLNRLMDLENRLNRGVDRR